MPAMGSVRSRPKRRLCLLLVLLVLVVFAALAEYAWLAGNRRADRPGRPAAAKRPAQELREQPPVPNLLYREPMHIVVDPEQKRAYVTDFASAAVSVVDMIEGRVETEVDVPAGPTGLALAAKRDRLYVASRLADVVSVVDLHRKRPVCDVRVDNQPYDVAITGDEKLALVTCAGSEESICVIDLDRNEVVRRITLPENPTCVAISPQGRWAAVSCDSGGLRRYLVLVDLTDWSRRTIPIEPAANLRRVVFFDERRVAVAYSIPRPHVGVAGEPAPYNHALALWDRSEPDIVRTLVLDEAEHYHANPYDLALLPGNRLAVSCSGDDAILVLDLAWLEEHWTDLPLASEAPGPREGVRRWLRRVACGRGPHGLAVFANFVVVCNRFDDTVRFFNVRSLDRGAVRTVRIGEAAMTVRRRGQILFNSAALCYRRQFSCSTCHPEGHTVRLAWDLLDDGIGTLKDVKSLRGIAGTGPFRWQGEARTVGTDECVPTVLKVMRGTKLPPEDVEAIEQYVLAIPLFPNPFRRKNGSLTELAKKGEKIFHEDYTAGCVKCHFPHDEDLIVRRNAGTGKGRPDVLMLPGGDRILPDEFDVPDLRGTWDSGPWLHDGRAKTLEEAILMHNSEEHQHLKGELMRAIVEYVRSF